MYDICNKLALRDYQEKMFLDILYKRSGLIRAPTGSGKTHIGAAVALYAVETGEPVAIMAPTIPILDQWVDKLTYLGIDVGHYGGPKRFKDGDIIVIGIQRTYIRLLSSSLR